MAESSVAITAGSGTLLHTTTTLIGGNTVHDQYWLPGEYPYASYFVQATAISVATNSDHGLQIMAGSSLTVRIRRIFVQQAGLVTTAQDLCIAAYRLSSAGTGGSALTPTKADTADSASGATAMTLPTAKGTEVNEVFRRHLQLTQTYPTAGGQNPFVEWTQLPNAKPIVLAPGVTNGIALKIITGRAGATADFLVEFVEMNH